MGEQVGLSGLWKHRTHGPANIVQSCVLRARQLVRTESSARLGHATQTACIRRLHSIQGRDDIRNESLAPLLATVPSSKVSWKILGDRARLRTKAKREWIAVLPHGLACINSARGGTTGRRPGFLLCPRAPTLLHPFLPPPPWAVVLEDSSA